MKKIFLGLILGVIAGGLGVWLTVHHPADKSEDSEKKDEPRTQRSSDGEALLKLDDAAQRQIGLETTTLIATEMKPEFKAFGRVLDPSSLAVSMTEIASTESALNASLKEAARLKTLFDQGQNASARSLEIADAAVARDRIAAEAARLRVLTMWGKSIAERPDFDGFVHSLVAQKNSLVRLEIPASTILKDAPASARVALLSSEETGTEASYVGEGVAVDSQSLNRSFLFLVRGRAWPVNAALAGWISMPGDSQHGAVVPRDAVIRHAGETFLYVQSGADHFARRSITLRSPVAAGWFTDEFKPGTKVVTSGAQQLLSEELKGEGGEE